MIDYYAIINVSPTIPDAEVKPALFAALRQWTNQQNHRQLERRQEAERNVAHLEEAKKVLLDPGKRAEYNKKLAAAKSQDQATGRDQVPAGDLIEAGWKYLADGNVAEALYVATKATSQQGENPDAWALLAQAKHRWGDTQDAIYEYKRAIQLRPNQASYYFDLGSVYESAEQYGDALQQYARAAKIDPGLPMYRAAMGIVHYKTDSFEESIRILEQCASEDPENNGFKLFLAVSYSESAQLGWTRVPENNSAGIPAGYYATTRDQVVQAQQKIAKAVALKFGDEELEARIRSVKSDIDSMMERKFQGSVFVPIVGGLIWAAAGGLGILLAILYFHASRPPRYAINKYALRGGMESADSAAFTEGFGAGLLVSAMYGLFLPIMVIVNYVRYYTGENAAPTG